MGNSSSSLESCCACASRDRFPRYVCPFDAVYSFDYEYDDQVCVDDGEVVRSCESGLIFNTLGPNILGQVGPTLPSSFFKKKSGQGGRNYYEIAWKSSSGELQMRGMRGGRDGLRSVPSASSSSYCPAAQKTLVSGRVRIECGPAPYVACEPVVCFAICLRGKRIYTGDRVKIHSGVY